VEDGYVYVGDHRNAVYALYADTGQQKWRYDTDGVVESSPVVDKGAVYVGSYDGKLYAIDAEAGHLKWTFTVRALL
jgi:outer membrane protein assembly factor BamB